MLSLRYIVEKNANDVFSNISRWVAANVSNRYDDSEIVTIATIVNENAVHLDIKVQPRPLSLKRNFVGLETLSDSDYQGDKASGGKRYLNDGEYQKPKSPIGHIPLGFQILFAALVFAISFYGLLYALLNTRRFGGSIAFIYALGGIFGIICSVALGLSVLTS